MKTNKMVVAVVNFFSWYDIHIYTNLTYAFVDACCARVCGKDVNQTFERISVSFQAKRFYATFGLLWTNIHIYIFMGTRIYCAYGRNASRIVSVCSLRR